MRRRRLIALALLFAIGASIRPALGNGELRIQRAVEIAALPLLVMEHERLIERTAEAMGIRAVTIAWTAPGKSDPVEAVGVGEAELAAADLVPFLIAADATAGTPAEVRALGALAQRPYVLVTRNPAISTIRDFSPGDRIAVPAVKTSGPALMLQMAAAQEWGPEQYAKLDPLTVARPDAAASTALLSGKGDITAHVSRTPYADDELAEPAIHRIMDSYDIAGPHSAAVLVSTTRFREANPVLCAAILSALQEAGDFIKKNPGAAAEIYVGMAKDQDFSVEELSDLIGDPDLAFTAAPNGVTRLAEFMHRVGRLKRKPAAWQDLFLPEARDLPGN